MHNRAPRNLPAKQAGISPGDLIVGVNGKTTVGKPADVSTGLIRGPAGTSVTLAVRDRGTAPPRSVTVQRMRIDVPLVQSRQTVTQTGQAMLTRRGRYVMREVKSTSRYPFGFFLKDRNYDVECECICFPEIIPQEHLNLASVDIMGSNQRFERGLGAAGLR